MGWGADGSAFAVTGALFLVCGAIAGSPVVRARRQTLASIFVAAAVFIAAGYLSQSRGGWISSPWIWCVALLPVVVIALFGPRVAAGLSVKHSTSRCIVPQFAARRKAASVSNTAEAATLYWSSRASDPAASGTELADLAYAHPELRVAIAANPATPANVLGWLASSGGDDVVDAIASRGSEHKARSAQRPPRGPSERRGNARESGN